MLDAVLNLAEYHREHEKYYAEAPLRDALELQRFSRTLKALAERWATVEPSAPEGGAAVPFTGAPDLNDLRAVETGGVLFMEGSEPPAEIGAMRRRLRAMAADGAETSVWLALAMDTAWEVAAGLLAHPPLADMLGERHRIITDDALSAAMIGQIAKSLERADAVLDHIDFRPAAVRADLAGSRAAVGYLYSASELLDHAADLALQSAMLVHANERRWRMFHERVQRLARDASLVPS